MSDVSEERAERLTQVCGRIGDQQAVNKLNINYKKIRRHKVPRINFSGLVLRRIDAMLMEWIGHSCFYLTTKDGKRLLIIDPYDNTDRTESHQQNRRSWP